VHESSSDGGGGPKKPGAGITIPGPKTKSAAWAFNARPAIIGMSSPIINFFISDASFSGLFKVIVRYS
jgi:hypothetical protein